MQKCAADMRELLVIDDEPTILVALGEYFSERGWEAVISTTMEAAERLLSTRRFDAVIADLRLTGVEGTEGLEIISYVRERQKPETVVTLLTAFGSDEIEEEALRRGADAVFRKPHPLADLEEQITALVARRQGTEG